MVSIMSNEKELIATSAEERKPYVISVLLTQDQEKALKTLDLFEQAQEIANAAVATAIRGKYKYHALKAKEQTAKSYDWAIRSGAKFDKDKGAFVNSYMREIDDVLKNL
jgi:hypothetical protein